MRVADPSKMAMENLASTEEALRNFQATVAELPPQSFIRVNQSIASKSLQLLEHIYNFTKNEESLASLLQGMLKFENTGQVRKRKKQRTVFSKTEEPLPKLITDSFDHDQIWEELKLQNNVMYETLISCTSRIMARNNIVRTVAQAEVIEEESFDQQMLVDEGEDEQGETNSEGEMSEDIEDDDDEISFEGNSEVPQRVKAKKGNQAPQNYAKSIVDDKFFNLAQMTEFLEKVEAQLDQNEDEGSSDEDIDFFEDIDENDDNEENSSKDKQGHNVYYNQYFDQPLEPAAVPASAAKSNALVPEKPSNFEKKRRKIEENIEQMEKAALETKSWKYQGEVTAEKRPENSLLEEHLVYDSLVRQAPEITMETTQRLEEIIKQRIKDKAWDDVERKIKPINDPDEYKKKLVLSAEKSKMSLAEIYEQEYINKKKIEEGETENESKPEEQLTIERDMKSLFAKLDALSNFHFTPKSASAEIKIVSNIPSIAKEEVIPVNVADSTLLAPREIQEPVKGEIKGKAERTETDRKHERRVKKKKQKLKQIAREKRAKLTGNTIIQLKKAKDKLSKTSDSDKNTRKNQIKFK